MIERRVHNDVTVIVPTVGRPLLDACLQSVLDGDSWPRRLVVVDQSPDGYAGGPVAGLQAAGLDVLHLPMPRRGVAAAMNHGLTHVGTSLVAVTHDDCRVHGTWLDRITAPVRDAAAPLVATGRILPEHGRDVPSIITQDHAAVYRRPLLDRDVLFPANMAFPAELWQRVGAMDEDPLVSASEDNEWAYRVLRAGVPICYTPEAVVTHVAWRDGAALARVEWAYARAQGAMYGKYLRRRDLHFARRLLRDLPHGVWWWLRGSASRNPTLANRGRAGSVGLLQGVVAGFRRGWPPPEAVRAPVGKDNP